LDTTEIQDKRVKQKNNIVSGCAHKFQNLDEEQRQAPLETRHSFSCPELLTATNLVMVQWHMQMITLFPPKEEHSDQLPQNSPSNHKGAI
jgi:hypothetical protein